MNSPTTAFLVYLQLIFITSKLWGQIEWGWFWVLSPLGIVLIAGFAMKLSHMMPQDTLGDLRGLAKKRKRDKMN